MGSWCLRVWRQSPARDPFTQNLGHAHYNQGNGTSLGTLTYGYDADGRRTSEGGTLASTAMPIPTTQPAKFDLNNRETSYNGQALSYNANGDLTNDGTNTYTWNARHQLTSVSSGGVTELSYAYDALGRRVSKAVEGGTPTQYLYDGRTAVQEMQGTTVNPILTGLGVDERFARNDVTGRTYFLTDALNSTIGLTDGAGALVEHYQYDPYGNVTESDTTMGFTNPYQYTGREADSSGLYYYRARYYSPLWGRFISEDPLGFGGMQLNFYAYVGGNPLMYVDPYGLDGQFGLSFSGSVFALFGGASGSVSVGITTDGTLAGTSFYSTEQVNPMAGLGLYAGVGAAPVIGHTDGPLQEGASNWTPYIEGDLGAGEAASAGSNFDFNGNFGLSGAYPSGPLKVFPGAGMGLMIGAGASKSWTQKSMSFCEMFNDIRNAWNKIF